MGNGADGLAIETRGLSKSYGGLVALKSLDLQVPHKSIFGMLGPKGAGKTTAIRLLLGLIAPTSGRGTVLGKDIARHSLELRARVGYLTEEPFYHDHMTARETLHFALRSFHGARPEVIGKRVEETLEVIGLAEKADLPVRELSPDERQRLGIGQAQVNHPELLILDEPAADLLPPARQEVLRVLESLRTSTTIVYATHVVEDVQQVSDTVAILSHGELVACTPFEDLRANPAWAIFTVVIKGDPSEAHGRLVAQPWVSDISATTENDQTTWRVRVTDETIAEAELLRLVLRDGRVAVTGFARKGYELESISASLVNGEAAAWK
jgi:ABC-2 type transport system ATP-binding protein